MWKVLTRGICLHSNLLYNETELTHIFSYQPGMSEVLLAVFLAPREIDPGQDPVGLERLKWTRLQDREKAIKAISAYRPGKLSSSGIHKYMDSMYENLYLHNNCENGL